MREREREREREGEREKVVFEALHNQFGGEQLREGEKRTYTKERERERERVRVLPIGKERAGQQPFGENE